MTIVNDAHSGKTRETVTPPRRRRVRALPVVVLRLIVLAAILIVWQLLLGRFVDPLYLPTPEAIWQATVASAEGGELWNNLMVTMEETLLGFVIGTIGALVAGLSLTRAPRLADVLDPFLVALNATPRVALAPLFVVWFGIGLLSKVVLVITLVFFIVFYNTLQGLRSVNRDYVRVSRVMGSSESQIFRKVTLPGAMPLIILGIKLALPYALIGAVIGEFIASSSGLGYQIKLSSNTYDTAGTMAGILVLMLVAVLLNMALERIARRILFWQPDDLRETRQAKGI
ncbi:ABC transporter permease [Nonomuraea sp. NPDC048916]|uniref:ABC transporter permease n=1 Tax=Nonomuraea sp. NPDC048916 TaxID=3154232 RepID=UPI003410D61B